MQTQQRSSHVERTAQNTRHELVSQATVIGMREESTTVKSLVLKVHNDRLAFRAGQWLDVFIPDVSTVGGFSMCSSPVKLTTEGTLDLAVKFSNHPPAHWVHTKCEVGSRLSIRVGGDFFFDPVTHTNHDLLLIAGGVGINPLFSILNHVNDLQVKGGNASSTELGRRVMLLYSSQTLEELIFREQLDQLQTKNNRIECEYFITRGESPTPTNLTDRVSYTGRRITAHNIEKCFDWLKKEETLAYICGPVSMLTDMEKVLLTIGMSKENIKYEKWW